MQVTIESILRLKVILGKGRQTRWQYANEVWWDLPHYLNEKWKMYGIEPSELFFFSIKYGQALAISNTGCI